MQVESAVLALFDLLRQKFHGLWPLLANGVFPAAQLPQLLEQQLAGVAAGTAADEPKATGDVPAAAPKRRTGKAGTAGGTSRQESSRSKKAGPAPAAEGSAQRQSNQTSTKGASAAAAAAVRKVGSSRSVVAKSANNVRNYRVLNKGISSLTEGGAS